MPKTKPGKLPKSLIPVDLKLSEIDIAWLAGLLEGEGTSGTLRF